MKHTPGPWSNNAGWCAEAALFENQDLCAAAPELLEAVKYLLDGGDITAEGIAKCRAAIAKAES
jgi:hypothetical protein